MQDPWKPDLGTIWGWFGVGLGMILVFFSDVFLAHVGNILWILWIRIAAWFRWSIFEWFWDGMRPDSDVCICWKHSKYWCFSKVPHILLICYFGVCRWRFRPHLGSFWESWGIILVVLEAPGNGLEVWWFLGPPRDTPDWDDQVSGWLQYCPRV